MTIKMGNHGLYVMNQHLGTYLCKYNRRNYCCDSLYMCVNDLSIRIFMHLFENNLFANNAVVQIFSGNHS